MHRRSLRILASSVATAVIMTGATYFDGIPQAAALAIHRGGTIVDALPPQVDINWYLPLRPNAYNSLYDAWASGLMYKGLYHIDPNVQINYSRSIASSIKWNSAGTVFTVDLNPKWHWSNGQPVTASDVQFTWNLINAASANNAPAPWPYAGADSGGIPNDVKAFKVVNPHEFQVMLNQSVNQIWFEYNGLGDFIPLPEKAWDKYPTNMDKELTYLANNGNNPSFFSVIDGPFKMVSAVQNVAWRFSPNPAYDGHKPYLSSFVLAYETSDTAEVSALKTGVVQVGYLPAYMYGSRSQLTGDRLFPSYTFSMPVTRFNFKSPTMGSIFKQLPVRQALMMGVDQESIIKDLYNGLAVPGTGPIPSHPDTFLSPKLHKPLYPFDIAAGKALLEKNGWHEVGGVMQNAKGQQLSFEVQYPSGNTTTSAEVQLLQQDWLQEGIKVTLLPLPFATLLHYHHEPSKWQVQAGIAWSYGGTYPTGGGIYGTGGGYNFFGYSNSTMDKLIKATHEPHPTAADAQAALNAYSLFAAQQLPNLYMPLPASLNEVSLTVHGVESSSNPFTNSISPQYWWTN
ncbi:MAG: ABC transporter substrate-binding protein [Firmicutes bacterium]|nr:ABC transporter substrate-binding protein [Bacillota bacterium]